MSQDPNERPTFEEIASSFPDESDMHSPAPSKAKKKRSPKKRAQQQNKRQEQGQGEPPAMQQNVRGQGEQVAASDQVSLI